MSLDSESYLSTLSRLITERFSPDNLDALALALDFDANSLPGDSHPARVRQLALALARNDRLPDLLAALREERPTVEWPPVPPDFRLPPGVEPSPAGGGGININTLTAEHAVVGPGSQMTITYNSGDERSGGLRPALRDITSTLRDVRGAVDNLPVAEATRVELIRLVGRLDRALQATPPGREAEAIEVADVTKALVEAAGGNRPSKVAVRVLGQGLNDAAAALRDVSPEVAGIVAEVVTAVVASPS